MTLKSKSAWSLLLLQSFFIVIFAVLVKYGPEADAADPSHTKRQEIHSRRSGDNNFNKSYPMFEDINVLVFIGIGFLYAFLGKYSYTGIGMNFLLCAISIQWGIITQKLWTMNNGKMAINIHTLIKSEFAAASGVIALGAIFGKVGLLQMIIFIMTEELLYSILNHCRQQYLQVCDFGESVALHLFAAIFGCSAAYVVDKKRKVQGNSNERSSYNSNIFCMLGAILVWCYWPSFNAAEDKGDSQHRTVINTFFALIGSGISCFAMSALLSEDSKFTMSHIQNGVIAGAVGVGSTANLMIQPFGALTIGALAGCLCVAGFKFFATFLARLDIYDPCGINSLHGLPGLFAGITGIFATFIANKETYGNSLYKIYPAMAPPTNVTAFGEFQEASLIKAHYGRTIMSQALFQLLYIILTMVTSCVTGLITGLILRMKILDPMEEKNMYIDEMMWKLSDIEINEVKPETEAKKNYCTF